MSKRHCYTVSICLFGSRDSKGPVKAVPSLAQHSPFPEVPGERGWRETLWIWVWGCSGAAGHAGCGTGAWLDLHQKLRLALLLREESLATSACNLPGIGFRAHLIKDCTDSLAARNSKYWSKTIFRDIADILKPAHVVLGWALPWTSEMEYVLSENITGYMLEFSQCTLMAHEKYLNTIFHS